MQGKMKYFFHSYVVFRDIIYKGLQYAIGINETVRLNKNCYF